jgi:outer membrane lipoprotein LolB
VGTVFRGDLSGGLARALAACTLALLAACAAPPPHTGPAWSGRLSLQVAATAAQAARAMSGSFELRGTAQEGGFELSNPLGATLAKASWTSGRYTLDDGRQLREFASLEDLAALGLGEPLPLQALFDWLRARPWAGATSAPRADALPGFEQLGWVIDTSEAAEGLLRAHRASPPAVTLRIRLDNVATR